MMESIRTCWRERCCDMSKQLVWADLLLFRKEINGLNENKRAILMNSEVHGNGLHGNRANLQTQSIQLIERFAELAWPVD